MKKKEADRLRDIAKEIDKHCNILFWKDPRNDVNCTQAYWFHEAAEEIRKVINKEELL